MRFQPQSGRAQFWVVGIIALIFGALGSIAAQSNLQDDSQPDAEFQIARLEYFTNARAGSRGVSNPIWMVDYPGADEHFGDAVQRLTKINTTSDSRAFNAEDPKLFHYPFLWMQQPGAGQWNPTDKEVKGLREYFDRGGFMIVDDFHGEREWNWFEESIQKVFPDRPIVDIPDSDPFIQIFFSLNRRLPVPGRRHVRYDGTNEPSLSMAGPSTWRGIYDEKGRLQVVALWNCDMGDAWEHADDPTYPAPMTLDAYRLGINLVLYSMTH